MAKQVVKRTQEEKQAYINAFMNRRLGQMFGNTVGTQTREALMASLLNPRLDINYECRYPTTVTDNDYWDMFARNGVAHRVVDLWPSECWMLPPSIYETEDEELTEFEKVWLLLEKKQKVLHYLNRIDVLSGVGSFGVLLFGLNDGKELKEPVDGFDLKTGEANEGLKYELLYLKPYAQNSVEVSRREVDNKSPRYGLPVMYTLKVENLTDNTSGVVTSTRNVDVHWTRVLHVADNRLSSEVFGEPRMKPVYNYLLDLRKIGAGSAEGFWRAGMGGVGFGIDPELSDPNLTITTDEEDDMKEELEDYYNGMQRYLILRGLKPHDISPKLTDPTPAMEVQIKQICITLGVPYRVFMGTEEAKLASGQDRTAWLERVYGKQMNYTTPLLVEPCIHRLQSYGVLPEFRVDNSLTVAWPRRDEPDEGAIAETAVKKAQAMSTFVQGAVSSELMDDYTFLTMVLRLKDEEAKSALKSIKQDLIGEEATTEEEGV